jgi:hypothetical protein
VVSIVDLLLTFPTVLYVALSAVCLLYWLLVIVGAADLDVAAAKAEAADGVLDAAASTTKGWAHAGSEALAAVGVAKVPLTVPLTIFGLLGFFLSVSTWHLLGQLLPHFLTAIVATGVSVVGAGGLTVMAVRPLAGLFADSSTTRAGGRALLGRTVIITIDADDHSGQARTDDEAIVSVRCAPGQTLARGEEAVLMDVGDDGVFLVESARIILPSTADAIAALEAPGASSATTVSAPLSTTASQAPTKDRP